MKSGKKETLFNITKSEFFNLKNKRGNRTIYITLLMFILCIIVMYRIKEKYLVEAKKNMLPQYANRFYGKILFENGQPAIIEPHLWEGAKTYITIEPPIPNNPNFTYVGKIGKNGHFTFYFSDELKEILNRDGYDFTIYCPWHDDEGGRFHKQVGKFPVKMLVKDMSKAKELRVKRPEDINDSPIPYVSEWTWLDQYQDEIMKLHKESFIADAEKMAEKIEWGLPENGLRCKLACSEQNIQTGDPLFLMIYFQNIGPNDIKLSNNIGHFIDLSLNGNIAGKGRQGFSYIPLGGTIKYKTIKSGEIVKEPLPVAAISYNRSFNDTGLYALSTSRPGIYNVKAIYPSRNSSNREVNKITSNELVIRVEPRDKVVYEGQFAMDKSLPVILYHGTENNLYLVKAQNIKFEKINNNINATLKISFNTIHYFYWQTELEILDDNGKVLSKIQRTDDNNGKAKIIDRDFRFSLGALSNMTNAKKFRIAFIPEKKNF